VDGQRLGVSAQRPGRGGAALGRAQEQAQDELREAESRPALLLRQEHHSQDARSPLRLPLRVQHGRRRRTLAAATVRHLRRHSAR